MKPIVSRRKKEQRSEQKEMKYRLKWQQKRSVKLIAGFLKKTKPLARFTNKEKWKEPNKIRNKRGSITTDTAEIQRIIRDYTVNNYTPTYLET